MKALKDFFSRSAWKLLVSTLLVTLVTVGAAVQGYNWFVVGLWSLGVAATIYIASKVKGYFSTAIVFIIHITTVTMLSIFYSSIISADFGEASIVLAFLTMTVATGVFTWAAVKFSSGRLWVTLLLVFVTLDVLGVLAIDIIRFNSLLVPIALAALVLLARCVLWRNVFSSRKNQTTLKVLDSHLRDLKSKDGVESISTLLSSLEGNLEGVSSDKYAPLDLSYSTDDAVYYLTIINSKKPIHVTESGVSTNGFVIDSLLYESILAAQKLHKKQGEYRNSHTALINVNDAGYTQTGITITPRGYNRTRATKIDILSPAALVKVLKN